MWTVTPHILVFQNEVEDSLLGGLSVRRTTDSELSEPSASVHHTFFGKGALLTRNHLNLCGMEAKPLHFSRMN